MGKIVIPDKKKGDKVEVPTKIEYYSKFKNSPMVRLSGNFMGGGFSISKNKLKAIFSNEAELKKFVKGDFDTQINALGEGEGYVPEDK